MLVPAFVCEPLLVHVTLWPVTKLPLVTVHAYDPDSLAVSAVPSYVFS